MGGLLRLADGGKQSQIRKGSGVGREPSPANSIDKAKSQILLVFFFRYECFESPFF
jgi:hypothetical protein